jgi:hypothetical protein
VVDDAASPKVRVGNPEDEVAEDAEPRNIEANDAKR